MPLQGLPRRPQPRGPHCPRADLCDECQPCAKEGSRVPGSPAPASFADTIRRCRSGHPAVKSLVPRGVPDTLGSAPESGGGGEAHLALQQLRDGARARPPDSLPGASKEEELAEGPRATRAAARTGAALSRCRRPLPLLVGLLQKPGWVSGLLSRVGGWRQPTCLSTGGCLAC